ncbi:hypothetical protein ACSBL2_21450 [Pedobacter sp. AW31-3R]|uniref:hypothetical protein n=1 Tax=Pedobacter sp. AW31-3R TaxID=3445781 RepID=UPI003F9F703F
MYRRDLLTAEIQKLGLALARIMGLKEQGKLEEAARDLDEIFGKEFGILISDLTACSASDFNLFLAEKEFPAEKLDMFSQFLFLKFNADMEEKERYSIAGKLQQIYLLLETKYHIINMINLNRQKTVEHYLKLNS